jgi:hypothetical protein
MASTQTFAQKTSAADKSIGFDYQYYYFLDRLLNLRTGESVGLEVLDDVHVSVNADLQLLFQLKHTTVLAADGKPVNLTALDDDLWKTMSNWANVIVDPNDGRADIPSQIAFIKKTEFHFVTNKSANLTNVFLVKILEFIEGSAQFEEVYVELIKLYQKTQGADTKQHLKTVLDLDKGVCERFFRKLRFQLGEDEVIAKIKRSISEKAIDAEHVDEVFARLDSNVSQDNFIDTKAGKPIVISYEEFMTRYRRIFTASRSKKLQYCQYTPVMPANLLSQRFVSQLLHISDVNTAELEMIAEYTAQKMRLVRNLLEWQKTGQLVGDEISAFHNEVKIRWRNQFRSTFRAVSPPPNVLNAAISLISVLRSENFKIGEESLNTELSNGELYHLSDIDVIGWHPGWETL